MSTLDTHELIYIADPMCSWCWGFSPVITAIEQQLQGLAKIRPIMGGLRPLTRTPMDEASKSEIAEHWAHVEERSGQPFDMSFFDRNDFVYDTEPACRAVCVVRRLNPALTLPYLAAVHSAFYTRNLDVTDGNVLAEIADQLGIDQSSFLDQFHDVTSVYDTAGDFHTSRQMQVTGFPSLIIKTDDKYALLSAGYKSYEEIKGDLENWLATN